MLNPKLHKENKRFFSSRTKILSNLLALNSKIYVSRIEQGLPREGLALAPFSEGNQINSHENAVSN